MQALYYRTNSAEIVHVCLLNCLGKKVDVPYPDMRKKRKRGQRNDMVRKYDFILLIKIINHKNEKQNNSMHELKVRFYPRTKCNEIILAMLFISGRTRRKNL